MISCSKWMCDPICKPPLLTRDPFSDLICLGNPCLGIQTLIKLFITELASSFLARQAPTQPEYSSTSTSKYLLVPPSLCSVPMSVKSRLTFSPGPVGVRNLFFNPISVPGDPVGTTSLLLLLQDSPNRWLVNVCPFLPLSYVICVWAFPAMLYVVHLFPVSVWSPSLLVALLLRRPRSSLSLPNSFLSGVQILQ